MEGFSFSTHSLYLRGIINHKSIKMKKLLLVLVSSFFLGVLVLLGYNLVLKMINQMPLEHIIKTI